MVEREVFFMKPKYQYLLSQWGHCVYSAQSWKEKRLFCEFVFIPIERRTSTPKMVGREVFLMKPKHKYHLSQEGERVYGAQSWSERRLYENSCFSKLTDEH